MAKMIPPQIPETCQSRGEREIFRRLKEDPGTEGWIVLHSLDLPNHVHQIWGEIDFVILVPGKGVLCLEAKGTGKLRRGENQEWYYGNDPVPDKTGPFKQSASGMQSLRRNISERWPHLSRLLFFSAVIFPYVPFREEGEWHPWQVIDQPQFNSKPMSYLVNKVLDLAGKHVSSKPTSTWYNPNSGEPSQERCEQLAKLLRPSFEYHEPAKSQAERTQAELIQFTEEQFQCLDNMELETRVAFVGPAGTGKTLLALESAKRAASNNDKVRLVCFNRLLGDWLQNQTRNISPNITSGNITQLMLQIVGLSKVPDDPPPEFWDKELPALAAETLIENGNDDFTIDQLVIDEAQDLLKAPFLDLFDLLVKGGLATGKWRLFGDFEAQMIYGQNGMDLKSFIEERVPNTPVFSLGINCRNTPRIAQSVEINTGVKRYKNCRRPDNEIDCRIFYYSDSAEQEKMLAGYLDDYSKNNFRSEDIIVLSSRIDSAASNMSIHPWQQKLAPIGQATRGQVPYHTIHGYKGMEHPGVIITDISDVEAEEARSLLYIGMTRGTTRVTVLASAQVRDQLRERLTNP